MGKRKVVLVGTGFVGMSMAYSMLNTGGIDELVLIDIDREKTIGEEMDLAHGLAFAPQKMEVKAGDYSECKDAKIVVITAGVTMKDGKQTRLELCQKNVQILKQVTENIMKSGFDGIIVVASNPVDIMTAVVQKLSKLPTNRVIGSGTSLDTARFRYLLAKYFDISPKNVHAYIMGEHGDSSFVSWEHTYIGCKKILDTIKDNSKYNLEEVIKLHQQVVNAAYEIIEKKRATYYGIGMALNTLVKSILNNENNIMTVSTYLDGQYGQKGIYIGVPAVININGVKEILELDLNQKDRKKLDNSVNILKSTINEKYKL